MTDINSTILKQLFDMSTKIDTVATTVKRHDDITFPAMQKELKDQSESLLRMESKQNKDILQFVEEKEKIWAKLNPVITKLETIKTTDVQVATSKIQARTTIATAIIGAVAGLIALFK